MAIIHEKQHLQLCLLHALNNLFQGETTFSRGELNSIASKLQGEMRANGLSSSAPLSCLFFNPHYNLFTGNYDANVMLIALQSRKAEAIWYDRRKGAEAMDLGEIPNEGLGNLQQNLENVHAEDSESRIKNLESDVTRVPRNELENPEKILIGIILNHPTARFSGFWKGRHWSALRKIGDLWYDLDSYHPSPVPIDGNNIKRFLSQSFLNGSEAFLVFRNV